MLTSVSFQTSGVLQVFFYRMQEFPEIQAKAQAELDAVVGRDRLPSFDDRANLPYINALCKELLRFNPPVPGGAFESQQAGAALLISVNCRCPTSVYSG